MTVLTRLTLTQKLVMLFAFAMTLCIALIATVAVWNEVQSARSHYASDVDGGLAVFASNLPREAQGFARDGDHPVQDLIRTGDALVIAPDVVDSIHDNLGVHVTYFRLVPETGEFERVMTSIQAPDGTRAVGTILDPAGPVKPELLAGRRYSGDATILGQPFLTRYDPVRDASGAIVGAVFAGVSIASIHASILEMMLAIGIAAGLSMALVVGFGSWMIRRALLPIRSLVAVVKRLERKDYEVEIPTGTTQDEVSDLARACAALRDDLREGARLADLARAGEEEAERLRSDLSRVVSDLRAGLARMAEGDLASPIPNPDGNPFPSEFEPLRQSFNSVLDRFEEVIVHVNDIARTVRDSAIEITDASRELSTRAETQAATLEQSAAALTELTQSVASTADRATQAQDTSNGNRAVAERGAEIVSEAVSAMQGIEKGSSQITRIIGVIEDIAFQTNLLALNAGVEAARAGDAGRGFAVVASEVRLLAQRASDSAREIKTLISDSTERVDAGSALVRRTGESLTEILNRANDTAGLVADIAMAAAEQARGLAEINSGVNQLDHVTQQNSAVAEETSAAAATLQSRSEELITALAGFRTRTRPSVATRSAIPAPAKAPDPVLGVEAKVANWAPAAAAAANGARANPVRQGAVWAEF